MPIEFHEGTGAPLAVDQCAAPVDAKQEAVDQFYRKHSDSQKSEFRLVIQAFRIIFPDVKCSAKGEHTGGPRPPTSPADLSWGRLTKLDGKESKRVLDWVCRFYCLGPRENNGFPTQPLRNFQQYPHYTSLKCRIAFPLSLYNGAAGRPIWVHTVMHRARPNNVKDTTAFAPAFEANEAPKTPDKFADFLKKWLDPSAVQCAFEKASR